MHSNGGSIEPGYLLSKTCKRLAKDHYVLVVARRAKSAATLIALGADEIHMGLMSELGPKLLKQPLPKDYRTQWRFYGSPIVHSDDR